MRNNVISLLNKCQSIGAASINTLITFIITTTDMTSVLQRAPDLIPSCTQVSASEIHTPSERVAPPSMSVFRIDPLWSTTTTV